MSKTMVAAVSFGLIALLMLALLVPTCQRGSAPSPVVIVDTVVVDTARTQKSKAGKGGKKKKAQKHKAPTPPPVERDYMSDPLNKSDAESHDKGDSCKADADNQVATSDADAH